MCNWAQHVVRFLSPGMPLRHKPEAQADLSQRICKLIWIVSTRPPSPTTYVRPSLPLATPCYPSRLHDHSSWWRKCYRFVLFCNATKERSGSSSVRRGKAGKVGEERWGKVGKAVGSGGMWGKVSSPHFYSRRIFLLSLSDGF